MTDYLAMNICTAIMTICSQSTMMDYGAPGTHNRHIVIPIWEDKLHAKKLDKSLEDIQNTFVYYITPLP
ncbi:MAG: hypothetical protein ACLTDF_04135 [Coprococcus sp.]